MIGRVECQLLLVFASSAESMLTGADGPLLHWGRDHKVPKFMAGEVVEC